MFMLKKIEILYLETEALFSQFVCVFLFINETYKKMNFTPDYSSWNELPGYQSSNIWKKNKTMIARKKCGHYGGGGEALRYERPC